MEKKRQEQRIDALDFARGFAIVLMILSHGVKGLLAFEQMPDWGLVPVHLVTKVSSSLFILVFGISLSVAYGPYIGSTDWPRRRQRLLIRGLVVLFWYKVLTVVEMANLYSREEILKVLLYGGFPVYVEILGFYAIALFWLPFILPVWKRTPLGLRLLVPAACGLLAVLLSRFFGFWGSEALRAILVEDPRYYTWGQFSRAPLVFLGLLLGDFVLWSRRRARARRFMVAALIAAGLACLSLFYWNASPALDNELLAIAKNQGKHPPELLFMLFSMGGAFFILALAFLGGRRLATALRPVTLIGEDALRSFVFHIVVIFVFYRYLFDYWHGISYSYALTLTGLLIVLTALWVKVLRWVQSKS